MNYNSGAFLSELIIYPLHLLEILLRDIFVEHNLLIHKIMKT